MQQKPANEFWRGKRPGRHAEIDPASAWEKAIILTPRPRKAQEEELKRMLLKTLNGDSKRDDSDLKDDEIEALTSPGSI